jgi:hypothetical protein
VDDDLAVRAATNNALWCDAVCRAHGVPTSFGAGAWSAREVAPRLYPNVVTLSLSGVEEQLRLISELKGSLTASGWAVKDSFDVLDLAPYGFAPLFRARWSAIAADKTIVSDKPGGLSVSRVDSKDELTRWESAWRVEGSDEDLGSPVFRPALLDDPDIAFISVLNGAELVAGLIANRGGGLAGVSNVFVTDPQRPQAVRLGLAEVQATWPGLPLVSYASGEDRLLGPPGFRDFAGLTVWRYVGDDVS